jgi:hypothetical protein
MAKRKHVAKRHSVKRRRHSVGSLDKSVLMEAAATIGGYVVGDIISTKVMPTLDAKIKGAAEIGIGLFLVPMVSKSPLAKHFGVGFATFGGVSILKNMGVINGMNTRTYAMPMHQQKLISGSGINQMVGGNGINQMVGSKRKSALRYGA